MKANFRSVVAVCLSVIIILPLFAGCGSDDGKFYDNGEFRYKAFSDHAELIEYKGSG